MKELLLYGLFPVTAFLLWLIVRKVANKPWIQLAWMALGLTLVQIGLLLAGRQPDITENNFFWGLSFVFAFYYLPCMLIMFVMFIVLWMMRDEEQC